MKKFFSVLAVLTSLGAGAFAETLMDASFTVPITGFLGNFTVDSSTDSAQSADSEEGSVGELSTVGIGASFGMVLIGEESKVGFGMKLGLDFPLSMKETKRAAGMPDTVLEISSKAAVMKMGDVEILISDSDVVDYEYTAWGVSSLLGVAIRPVNTGRFSLILIPGIPVAYSQVDYTLTNNGVNMGGDTYHSFYLGLGLDVAGLYHFTDMVYAKLTLSGSVGLTITGKQRNSNGDGDETFMGFGGTFRPELGVGVKL